jgi:SAM-dependent methyltransferase
MNKSILDQKKRYDAEAAQHAEHYNDEYTQMYRDEFIRAPLFKENLKGMYILDAMCASGIETGYLLKQGANVVGVDISQKNVNEYNKRWGKPCFLNSIHKTDFSNNTFDAIYICGGLHHVLPLLNETILEIHRILKPGGLFYFVEPNKDTWVNKIRKLWYSIDSKFADDEEAISYNNTLKPFLSKGFKEKSVNFGGNIAYIVIAQSLALGIPKRYKKYLTPITFFLERVFSKLPIVPKLFFTAVWKKNIE